MGRHKQFQSTHPQRVRRKLTYMQGITQMISIHAPTKGATSAYADVSGYRYDISIHAPTKGATEAECFMPLTVEFQSTHPQRVRRYHNIQQIKSIWISIHAPTKGATAKICNYIAVSFLIFIYLAVFFLLKYLFRFFPKQISTFFSVRIHLHFSVHLSFALLKYQVITSIFFTILTPTYSPLSTSNQ